jgi:hypothetical protein
MRSKSFAVHSNRLVAIVTSVCLVSSLTACSGSSSKEETGSAKIRAISDFSQVCNKVALDPAPAYSKTPGSRSIAFFERQDQQSPFQTMISTNFPVSWEITGENFQENQLVACVSRKSTKLAKTCDNYEVEDDKTKEKKKATLELYDADYEVAVYEAKTAKVLESKVINIKGEEECPMFASFSSDSLVEKRYPQSDQALVDFVKPYVEGQ